MTRRSFGVLGEVSALTLGGAGLMGGWGHEPDLDEAVATIRAAVDAGIDHIDVAPAYGDGGAERVVGAAFGGSLPAGVRISTKVPLDRPAPGTALGLIERSLTASLQRLLLPRVDLLLTHCWLVPDGEEGAGRSGLPFRDYVHEVRPDAGAAGGGRPHRRLGDQRHRRAGDRAGGPGLASAARGRAGDRQRPELGRRGGAVPRAAGRIGCGGGRRCRRTGDRHPRGRPRRAGRRAGQAGRRRPSDRRRLPARSRAPAPGEGARGIPAARLAYRYALSLPEVATVAIGVRNRAELADAIAAERDGPMDDAEMAELRAACPLC